MENIKTKYFLRAVEFWPTFDIRIVITLTALFRKPTEVSQNMPTFISIELQLGNNGPLKKCKICVFCRPFFSK